MQFIVPHAQIAVQYVSIEKPCTMHARDELGQKAT